MPEKRTRGSPETVAVTLRISLISCARRRRDEPDCHRSPENRYGSDFPWQSKVYAQSRCRPYILFISVGGFPHLLTQFGRRRSDSTASLKRLPMTAAVPTSRPESCPPFPSSLMGWPASSLPAGDRQEHVRCDEGATARACVPRVSSLRMLNCSLSGPMKSRPQGRSRSVPVEAEVVAQRVKPARSTRSPNARPADPHDRTL